MIFVIAIPIVLIVIGWAVSTGDFATLFRTYIWFLFALAVLLVGILINDLYLWLRRHFHPNVSFWAVVLSTFWATQEVAQQYTEYAWLIAGWVAWFVALIILFDMRDDANDD